MSQKKLWMLAAIRPLVLTIVFCGATVGLTACDKANAQNDNPASAVKSEELIRTSQSWDGVELPDYLQGRPELVNTIHHGENRGTKPVILYMFYLSQEGLPLAVQHPDISLE